PPDAWWLSARSAMPTHQPGYSIPLVLAHSQPANGELRLIRLRLTALAPRGALALAIRAGLWGFLGLPEDDGRAPSLDMEMDARALRGGLQSGALGERAIVLSELQLTRSIRREVTEIHPVLFLERSPWREHRLARLVERQCGECSHNAPPALV